MKKIKVEQLTKEAFAEFGEVLSYEGREDCGAKGSHTWYPQVVVRDTPTSINLMEVFRKPFTVKKFEAHDHTEENLFADVYKRQTLKMQSRIRSHMFRKTD